MLSPNLGLPAVSLWLSDSQLVSSESQPSPQSSRKARCYSETLSKFSWQPFLTSFLLLPGLRLAFSRVRTGSRLKRIGFKTSRRSLKPVLIGLLCRTSDLGLTTWQMGLELRPFWLRRVGLPALTFSPSLENYWVGHLRWLTSTHLRAVPTHWLFLGNVNNQASLRTRGVPASVSSSEPSSLSFEDLGALLRGSADILDRNAPRFQAIAAQAGVRGW